MNNIPTSLYIHFPWCVRKCPYCDFNSHAAPKNLNQTKYIDALIADLKLELTQFPTNELYSIFLGGGTPSLFSAAAINRLLQQINKNINFKPNCEISMEINPATCTQQQLSALRAAGINRLSIGVQTFADDKLKALGRIHNRADAINTIKAARRAGFDNINLDLMHSLPQQTPTEALADLKTALQLQPTHLSCYQLTIAPGTAFYRHPPPLPDEELLIAIQQQINAHLTAAGFKHYEISNYCRDGYQCRHNLNYWQFGDYLAIGAGAHGKLTNENSKTIVRYVKPTNPIDYLRSAGKTAAEKTVIKSSELPLEFMLNALRLIDGLELNLFTKRTGLELAAIQSALKTAINQGFIENNSQLLKPTPHGLQFLNQCLEIF